MQRIKQLILTYCAVISVTIVSLGVCAQAIRIIQVGSSRDISMIDLALRFTASLLYLVKFRQIKDKHLVLGQWIFMVLISSYILIAIGYRFWPQTTAH